jgi:hypothetical protein
MKKNNAHSFLLLHNSQKVLYRTLYPDATEMEWKSKKYDEKHVRAMTLLDPNVDLSVIWYKEDEPEDISQRKWCKIKIWHT